MRTALSLVATLTVLGLLVPAAGDARVKRVFDGAVKCSKRAGGIQFCGSVRAGDTTSPARTLARSWDGTAVDVNFALPKGSAGRRRPYPLVMLFHGYGGSKLGIDDSGGGIANPFASMLPWLKAGYATFSMSDRGFGESCGTAASRASVPAAACRNGFNHLLDTRYEVRDAQYFAGRLVDQGLVAPKRIAAAGGSYGGGMSMALAALKDRVMLRSGKLVRWRSAEGAKLRLAAAAPSVPWTDLSYALVPNGSTLDYVADAPYEGRLGVMKQSYVNALYLVGCETPTTSCTTTDPRWNLGATRDLLNRGEPYDDPALDTMLEEIQTYHSSYAIDDSKPPAPLLIQNGWTDDLFPVDEALRFYNRTKTTYPRTPVSLFFTDIGHMRAQNKQADQRRYRTAVDKWMRFYVKGKGRKPFQGVQALTETCPSSAPSAGPFKARSWAALAPGEVRLSAAPAQTIQPDAGDPGIGATFDAVTGSACATAAGATQPGVATYLLDVTSDFTLLGSPTVVADFTLPGATSQVAARLLDVGPDGKETLVARGLWRPRVSGTPSRQVFQLHPGAWRFAAGHKAKLELLPDDAPYGRASNGQQPVTVAGLELRLPTREKPGANGLVRAPLPKVLPPGAKLARG